ncbi:MAG TPA: xylulokinase [bacterium]
MATGVRAFLGIDCGTQSTKAILIDSENVDVLAVGRAPHELIEHADGTREQEPTWWIKALKDAVADTLHRSGRTVQVAGIGVSGQQHGLVCLDAGNRPIRAAKLWNDTTTSDDCALLTDRLGGPSGVLALTGNLFLPGYTAPKVSWLLRNESGTYRRAERFCLPHDFINLWLTGEFATEPGDASGTAYFDVRRREYSSQVLTAIDPARNWEASLPPVGASLAILGHLRPEAAEALGLPAGIPVSAGGGDNMCAAIGSGAVSAGPVVVSLGTSGTVFAYRPEPAVDPEGEAAAFCSSTDGWLPLACTLNVTVATDWIRTILALDHAGFEGALTESAPGADGLTFLPYLGGERTPNRPHAAGIFAGLRARHGRSELIRAVVEGVTFGLAYAVEALVRTGVQVSTITLVGGGAASNAWGQICADIFGVLVERPALHEAAALGAALQVRHVVDGAPLSLTVAVIERWEPRRDPALEAAAARATRLRRFPIEGGGS